MARLHGHWWWFGSHFTTTTLRPTLAQLSLTMKSAGVQHYLQECERVTLRVATHSCLCLACCKHFVQECERVTLRVATHSSLSRLHFVQECERVTLRVATHSSLSRLLATLRTRVRACNTQGRHAQFSVSPVGNTTYKSASVVATHSCLSRLLATLRTRASVTLRDATHSSLSRLLATLRTRVRACNTQGRHTQLSLSRLLATLRTRVRACNTQGRHAQFSVSPVANTLYKRTPRTVLCLACWQHYVQECERVTLRVATHSSLSRLLATLRTRVRACNTQGRHAQFSVSPVGNTTYKRSPRTLLCLACWQHYVQECERVTLRVATHSSLSRLLATLRKSASVKHLDDTVLCLACWQHYVQECERNTQGRHAQFSVSPVGNTTYKSASV
ncbi:hypothetical protein J6590_078084 [Homalodisca vitripennis]|nr:hypothetical protein J6590_078084 [Homalodisca vitripennis]